MLSKVRMSFPNVSIGNLLFLDSHLIPMGMTDTDVVNLNI